MILKKGTRQQIGTLCEVDFAHTSRHISATCASSHPVVSNDFKIRHLQYHCLALCLGIFESVIAFQSHEEDEDEDKFRHSRIKRASIWIKEACWWQTDFLSHSVRIRHFRRETMVRIFQQTIGSSDERQSAGEETPVSWSLTHRLQFQTRNDSCFCQDFDCRTNTFVAFSPLKVHQFVVCEQLPLSTFSSNQLGCGFRSTTRGMGCRADGTVFSDSGSWF